jgi:hypothetical protein
MIISLCYKFFKVNYILALRVDIYYNEHTKTTFYNSIISILETYFNDKMPKYLAPHHSPTTQNPPHTPEFT